jgi:hypothetical protein
MWTMSAYLTHPHTHPDMDSDEPDPRLAGPGHAYACLDCNFKGRGAAAYDHHRNEREHRIVFRDAPDWGVCKFGCCHEL